jgi:hypothetical protein
VAVVAEGHTDRQERQEQQDNKLHNQDTPAERSPPSYLEQHSDTSDTDCIQMEMAPVVCY